MRSLTRVPLTLEQTLMSEEVGRASILLSWELWCLDVDSRYATLLRFTYLVISRMIRERKRDREG